MYKHKSGYDTELSRVLVKARKARQGSPVDAINTLVKTGKELGLSDVAVADYVLKELRR